MSITSSTIGKRTFKVILLGDTSTGKTSIIERFVNNKFQEKDNPTIGIDFLGKNVTHNATTCRLQLWDTAGQERYRSLIPSYLKDAVCAIFVFDVGRSETLHSLQSWIDLFRDNRGDRTIMALCGNKCDLAKEIDHKQLSTILQKYKMRYYETSALTGHNIENMFLGCIDDIVAMQQARRKKVIQEEDDILPPKTTDNMQVEGMNSHPTEITTEHSENIKLKREKGTMKKICCLGMG